MDIPPASAGHQSDDFTSPSTSRKGRGVAEHRYRLGIAGLVHDHVWNELPRWAETGRVEFVAAADPQEALRERVAREYRVRSTYASIVEMLKGEQLDVVQVCTSNAEGVAVVEAAARRGIHAVVEKPMAATLHGAERMLEAVHSAGTKLMINWPFRWRPAMVQAWEMVRDGILGSVFHSRIRMAHKGPRETGCSDHFCDWLYDASQNGAGALLDYCSYGAVAFRHLFGMPDAVQSVAARLTKTDISVEDNAAITLIYPERHASAEASWSQIPSYHDAVFLGTEATLWTHKRDRLFLADESRGERELPVQPLPDGEHTGPAYFVKCLDQDREPDDVCSPDICRDAQEILAAGLDANTHGRRVPLPFSSQNE